MQNAATHSQMLQMEDCRNSYIYIWFFNSDTQSIFLRSFAFIFVWFVGVRYDIVFSCFFFSFLFWPFSSAENQLAEDGACGTQTEHQQQQKKVGEE